MFVAMKGVVLWDVTPCGLVQMYRLPRKVFIPWTMKGVVLWDMTPCRLVQMYHFQRNVFILWTEVSSTETSVYMYQKFRYQPSRCYSIKWFIQSQHISIQSTGRGFGYRFT